MKQRAGLCVGRIQTIALTLGAFGFLMYVYVFKVHDDKRLGHMIKTSTSLLTKDTLSGSDVSTRDDSLRPTELFDVTETDSFSRFIRFNLTDDGTQCKGRRFLIYTCKLFCCGWGDRLKGISTLFLMAQLTNRIFLIDMPIPCELHMLVKPNLYDWHKCLAEANAISSAVTHPANLMNGRGLMKMDELIFAAFGRRTVISVQTNINGIQKIRKHHLSGNMVPWIRSLTDAEVIGSIIGTLFKPSMKLSDALVKFKTEKVRERRLVCSHIRLGRNPTIPNDGMMMAGVPNVSQVLNFLRSYDDYDDVAIFVATDSMEIRNQSRKMFSNFVSTDKMIVHVDKAILGTNELCDGFFAALLDQLILSRCDVLVLTRSNFGAMAAYMRGESENLFLNVQHKNNIVNVTVSGIQDIYAFV